MATLKKERPAKAPDPAAAKPSDIKDAPDNAEHVATIPETKQGLQPDDLPTGERSHPR
jgi:hypothetical protein